MTDEALFDLVSYGRVSPGHRRSLTIGQIKHITRTVGRTPEVMVKVINKGSSSLAAVGRHVDYIGRKGEVELETDDGEILRGKDVEVGLLEDWNLDLTEQRGKINLTPNKPKEPPRLVYKLIFSMPAGTPPEKVQAAVRNFAREEFGLKHRYVMALHTDEPHPHVHLLLKATNDKGSGCTFERPPCGNGELGSHIHLRALGVPANATPRQIRGVTIPRKSDGIYRASKRRESTHVQERVAAVARELNAGKLQIEPGKEKLLRTREDVRRAWLAVSDTLSRDGHTEIATQVRRYVEQMPRPGTEKEYIAATLLARHAREPQVREIEMAR